MLTRSLLWLRSPCPSCRAQPSAGIAGLSEIGAVHTYRSGCKLHTARSLRVSASYSNDGFEIWVPREGFPAPRPLSCERFDGRATPQDFCRLFQTIRARIDLRVTSTLGTDRASRTWVKVQYHRIDIFCHRALACRYSCTPRLLGRSPAQPKSGPSSQVMQIPVRSSAATKQDDGNTSGQLS